jgi:hypothetical protein
MMDRIKHVQTGTGQVGFLFGRGDRWLLEIFVGGPDGFQQVAEWATLQEAKEWLRTQGFKPEQPNIT